MSRLTDALRLPALLGAEVALLLALHRLGDAAGLSVDRDAPLRWLAATPPDVAVAALARLFALGVAGWLLASTAAYTVARLSRVPAAVRAAARLTVPAVRRTVERGLTVGLLAGTLSSTLPAVAAPPPAPPPPVQVPTDGDAWAPPGVRPPPAAGARADVPPTVPDADAPRPPDATRPSASQTVRPVPGVQVEVVPGDNLWVIARRALTGAGLDGRPATVAPYWRRVVHANRGRLRSGDPDLIHPGEVVELPPTEDAAG